MATLYERYQSGATSDSAVYGSLWRAQTFTPSIGHGITSVKLYLRRIGSPGTLTASIRATIGGEPVGADLTSGTTDADTLPATPSSREWREITLDTTVLSLNTEYAIVIRCLSGNVSNAALWGKDSSGSYAGGEAVTSSDSGGTWGIITGNDYLFEEYGNLVSTASPSVTTQATSSITGTSATGNGNVTDRGLPVATQYGHVWAAYEDPTIDSNEGITQKGVPSATGAFTSSITSLNPNTHYHIRTYITSDLGTFYGVEWQFGTFQTSVGLPTVTTETTSYVYGNNALGNGTIVSSGGSDITQHGHCWVDDATYDGGNHPPTTADSKTENGTAGFTGTFTSFMSSLSVSTLYHIRAYATNSSGTDYGADVTFTTIAAGAPMVRTDATTSIRSTAATGNGNIIDLGGSVVTAHGHCWSTTVNPTTADSKVDNGAGVVGAFTSAITSMTAGTAYYLRAYATNTQGTSYGNNDLINELAGEEKGVFAVAGEFWVYTSKSGKRRAVYGVEY